MSIIAIVVASQAFLIGLLAGIVIESKYGSSLTSEVKQLIAKISPDAK